MSRVMGLARTTARQNSKSFGRPAASLVRQRSLISRQSPVMPSAFLFEYSMSRSRPVDLVGEGFGPVERNEVGLDRHRVRSIRANVKRCRG